MAKIFSVSSRDGQLALEKEKEDHQKLTRDKERHIAQQSNECAHQLQCVSDRVADAQVPTSSFIFLLRLLPSSARVQSCGTLKELSLPGSMTKNEFLKGSWIEARLKSVMCSVRTCNSFLLLGVDCNLYL